MTAQEATQPARRPGRPKRIRPEPAPLVIEDGASHAGTDFRTEESLGIAAPRTAHRTPDHQPATAARDADHEPAHEAPRGRTRSRRSSVQEDMFYIPVEEIPEGSSYEWKRFSNVGQEDPFYIAQMRQQGWEPVDPRKHPNWVPPGYKDPYIIKGGQILMERPIELTQEARREQRQLAKTQMIEAEQRLGMTPKDTMTRQHPEIAPKVTKEIGRMIQVED